MDPQPRTLTGWLTVAQVAEELSLTPDGAMSPELKVLRLISRGRLVAARLGENGPYRVSVDALGGYIRGGAPDLNGPRAGGGWFDGLAFIRQRFTDAMIAAAVLPAFLPPEADVREVRLAVNPAQRIIAQSPVPPPNIRGAKPAERFLDRATAYFVAEFRRVVERAAAKGPKSRLVAVYNPDRHDELTAAGLDALGKGGIRFTHSLPTVPDGADTRPVGFVVPHSPELLTQARKVAVLAAAF